MKNTEHIFISYVEYFLARSYHQLGKFFSLVNELLFWPFIRYSTSSCLSFHTGDKNIPLTCRDVVLINWCPAALFRLLSLKVQCMFLHLKLYLPILLKKISFGPQPAWVGKSSQWTQEIRTKHILCTPQNPPLPGLAQCSLQDQSICKIPAVSNQV